MRILRIGTRVVATLVAGSVVLVGAYLLLVGPDTTIVTPAPGSVTSIVRNPSLAGLVPLVAGISGIYGASAMQARFVWLGAFVMLGAAVLFLFSLSAIFFPLGVLLLSCAVAMTLVSRLAMSESPAASKTDLSSG